MIHARAIAAFMLAGLLPGCIMVHARTIDEPVASAAPVVAAPPAPAPAPVAAPTGPAPLQVANPTYVTIPMEITVNKPVKDVWARIGKYCDIAEWFQIATGCEITSGKDDEVGAVRTVGAEILVAKTEYSYAYTQPVRQGRPYNLYHGNLEARAIDAKTTKLLYTLVYDLSLVAGDDAAKAADVERRRTAFNRALGNMKILAEGGALPPPAPRN
ncbi:MAG: SRPBCC family protein [Hyphomonadaceae bacterium]|nr:SRPBCC family protein [Hyphomonadaceae bacterium]